MIDNKKEQEHAEYTAYINKGGIDAGDNRF